jgi:hypothetical protein
MNDFEYTTSSDISDKYVKLEIMRMATDIFNTAVESKSVFDSPQKLYLDLVRVYNDSVIIDREVRNDD